MIDKVLSKSKLISLDEETHTYSLSDSEIKFQSVTEFIHTFFNPFDEQKIAKKLTETNIKYKGMTVEELIASWNKRRDRGTVIHKEIEEYINSNFKIKDELNIDSKSIQGINFLNQKCIKESNILASEVIIFSEKLKLAGTIDLLIYNKKKNHISIVDWKTNKKINKNSFNNSRKGIKFPLKNLDDCNFNHYNLQLSMYQYILEEFYKTKVNGLFIVHLNENYFNYKNFKCEYKKNLIESMLSNI